MHLLVIPRLHGLLDLGPLEHLVFEHLFLLLLLLELILQGHELLVLLFENFILTIMICNGCPVFILDVDSYSFFMHS